MTQPHTITAFETIMQAIKKAQHNACRQDVELIAVSKTFPAAKITPLLDYGHKSFGENKVQEAQKKWYQLKQKYTALRLHLIGPLQTNKVKDALKIFDVIHSLDREKLARVLAQEIRKEGKNIPLFIQINTGEEPQKSGVLPHHADDFIRHCRQTHNLNIIGLMCIPPITDHAAPHFALLDKIAKRNKLEKLSMGMSADYETAIGLGATHIRVGSAIFGSRDT